MTAPQNSLARAFLDVVRATATDAKRRVAKVKPRLMGALLARVLAMGQIPSKPRESPLSYAQRMRREGRWDEYIRKPNIIKRRRVRQETGDRA